MDQAGRGSPHAAKGDMPGYEIGALDRRFVPERYPEAGQAASSHAQGRA
jgi:hypothetical protein